MEDCVYPGAQAYYNDLSRHAVYENETITYDFKLIVFLVLQFHTYVKRKQLGFSFVTASLSNSLMISDDLFLK